MLLNCKSCGKHIDSAAGICYHCKNKPMTPPPSMPEKCPKNCSCHTSMSCLVFHEDGICSGPPYNTSHCFRCHPIPPEIPDSSKPLGDDDNWHCSLPCNTLNAHRYLECSMCGKPKSSSDKGILNNSRKKILDVCCGGRMFWFNKNHPDALYVDRRIVDPVMVGKDRNARMFSCQPDEVMDFRELKIESNSFSLVVFDPPHLTSLGVKSYMAKKYGILDKNTWREDLRKGFSECFRVLKENGILIFKWNETDIPLSKILALTPIRPLFGHPSGKTARTHWVTFMKPTLLTP